jgi:hypothetical protein
MYRNKKLLEVVRDAPICFNCGRHNDGTIVAAHSNQGLHGKGRSLKADDCFIAALCYVCHSDLDQGTKLSREERVAMWNAAAVLTYGWLIRDGRIKVL